MKIKKFGNCLLIFTLAFLFLISFTHPTRAQQVQCACSCHYSLNNTDNWLDNPNPLRGESQADIESQCQDFCPQAIEALEGEFPGIELADPPFRISNCTDIEGAAVPPAPAAGNQTPPAVQQLTNPLGAGADIPEIIARVIKAVLGMVGSIGLLMFIYGGFLWLTAGGSAERVEKGRGVLVWATLGLLVIFSAYAILSFVIGALTRSTG